MRSIEGDVGDVDFEVFVGVSFTSVTLQCEGWKRVKGYGMVDESGKSGGEVVRRDMGSREVVRVVGWDMSGM